MLNPTKKRMPCLGCNRETRSVTGYCKYCRPKAQKWRHTEMFDREELPEEMYFREPERGEDDYSEESKP